MNGFSKLLKSYKGVAFVLVIIALTVLVAMNKATSDQLMEFVKWGFIALAGSRAVEEGMKARGPDGVTLNMLKSDDEDDEEE